MNVMMKLIKENRSLSKKEWEDRTAKIKRQEVLDKSFVNRRRISDVIMNLWYEAECVKKSIGYERKELERIMKKVDKRRIFGLKLEVREKKEEIETLEKFEEELKGLSPRLRDSWWDL